MGCNAVFAGPENDEQADECRRNTERGVDRRPEAVAFEVGGGRSAYPHVVSSVVDVIVGLDGGYFRDIHHLHTEMWLREKDHIPWRPI